MRPDGPSCSISPRITLKSCGSSSRDRKSTRLNSSHSQISYAVFCLKKKKTKTYIPYLTNHYNFSTWCWPYVTDSLSNPACRTPYNIATIHHLEILHSLVNALTCHPL